MKKKRYSPGQVIRKLREAEALKAQGKTVAQICQALEISEQSYHRWKARYGNASCALHSADAPAPHPLCRVLERDAPKVLTHSSAVGSITAR